MLKTTRLLDKPAFNKNDNSKSALNRNNDSRLAFEKNDNINEVDGFGMSRNDMEYAKKLGKLFKLGKSKSKKTFKSQNLIKLRKKLSKSGNSTNFNVMEARPKFLTPDARTAFNCLWLTITEVPIL